MSLGGENSIREFSNRRRSRHETPHYTKEEIIMITKTKIALVAALVLGTSSAAMAVDVTAGADKDRGFTTYQQQAASPQLPAARGQLIEGRNVGIEGRNLGIDMEFAVPAEQMHWYERNPVDFNT
jgi:hypothetical protein